MPKILLTGASGVLGSAVLAELAAAGVETRVLTRHSASSLQPGLEAATRDIGTVIHCASGGAHRPSDDPLAMRNLIEACRRARVGHFLYISIVGIERLTWFPLYEAKLACERLLMQSGLPWSIQRATQFHPLAAYFLTLMVQGPLLITPSGAKLQPVDAAAVARVVAQAAQAPAAQRLPDLAGPQVRSIESLAAAWKKATGRKNLVIPVPLPMTSFRLLRSNLLYSPQCLPIGMNWEEWLIAHAMEPNPYASR